MADTEIQQRGVKTFTKKLCRSRKEVGKLHHGIARIPSNSRKETSQSRQDCYLESLRKKMHFKLAY